MATTEDLFELADQAKDEASFQAFLMALAGDKAEEEAKEKLQPSSPWGPGANGWENGSIDVFLERACAWARSTCQGTEMYQPPENPWTRLAHILHAGKFYE